MPEKDCHFCQIIANQADPTYVCELEHSTVFVDFEQNDYPGSSLLVLKKHYEHMHEIPNNLLHAFIDERTQLANAILKAFPDTIRINYANLGNASSHVHEYLIPRHEHDRHSGRAPWPVKTSPRLSDIEYQEIAAKIRSSFL